MDPATWPASLHAVLVQYGTRSVWCHGLAVLGYPPTWIDTGKEAAAVIRSLAAN